MEWKEMIDKKQQVCSLELAAVMGELEFKQYSLWYWTWAEWNDEVEWVLIPQKTAITLNKEMFSAYTVAELGETLPGQILHGVMPTPYYLSIEKFVYDEDVEWCVKYRNESICDTFHSVKANSEADARAKMCIWLRKEGFI